MRKQDLGVFCLGILFFQLATATPPTPPKVPDSYFKPALLGYPSAVTNLQLICDHTSVKSTSSCKAPSSDVQISIPQATTVNNFSVSLAAIQKAVFPTDYTCPITSMTCKMTGQVAGAPTNFANLSFSNLGLWSYIASFRWAANLVAVKTPTVVAADYFTVNVQDPIKTNYYQTLNVNSYYGRSGRISLTNPVNNKPARLVCDKNTFISQTDPSTQSEYFDLATVFQTLSTPNVNPINTKVQLSNCLLTDSAQTAAVYAVLPQILDLGLHPATDSNGPIWAAATDVVAAVKTNYYLDSVTKQISAKDNQLAYNQTNINILPLTAGTLSFGGESLQNYTDGLTLNCDNKTKFVATRIDNVGYQVDLRTMHDAVVSSQPVTANAPESYNSCSAILANGKTIATFALTGIVGTNSLTPPSWVANLNAVKQGADSPFSLDPTVVKTNCETTDSETCNQSGLNFLSILPGYIDILDVPLIQGTVLKCGAQTFPATPLSNGVHFDLHALHGSIDPTQAVDLGTCYLSNGVTNYGSLDISSIDGVRTLDPTQPNVKFWSAAVTNLLGLTYMQSANCDAATPEHCNTWQFKDTV